MFPPITSAVPRVIMIETKSFPSQWQLFEPVLYFTFPTRAIALKQDLQILSSSGIILFASSIISNKRGSCDVAYCNAMDSARWTSSRTHLNLRVSSPRFPLREETKFLGNILYLCFFSFQNWYSLLGLVGPAVDPNIFMVADCVVQGDPVSQARE